ncbi:hypothetical protein ABZT47_39695 [Sphaerisporangium sp. NPDC005289]|uniref:hypothetical protein n=1 Tax=Sphaerisporangium sp. NPDC005289 TaxID=3155247 RepID=UPI0033AEC207
MDRRAVLAGKNMATRVAEGEAGRAPQLREPIAFQKIAEALGVDPAAGNLVAIAPEDDRKVMTEVVQAAFGKPVEPLALGRRI